MSSIGSNPMTHDNNNDASSSPSPPTHIYGPHASKLKALLTNTNSNDDDNIPIKLVNAMEETHIASMRKIMWSSALWLLFHSRHPPIDTHAAHANEHEEDVIK